MAINLVKCVYKFKFYRLYLIAISLICIGYISILPPFEGFDESAHLSSILEVSTGKLPVYGQSSLDRRLSGFEGATPYRSGLPPFDLDGRGYKNFFDDAERVSIYKSKYVPGVSFVGFQPDDISVAMNWQAQHPPLYYLLMSWVPHFFGHLNFLNYIFLLRLLSASLFIFAVFIVTKIINKSYPLIEQHSLKMGLILYPMILPMVFLDISRIGNDSLCCLICALTAYFIQALLRTWDMRIAFYLGGILGLGLLTKAFFLPIGSAILLFLFLAKGTQVKLNQRIYSILIIFVTMTSVGAWWYVKNYYVFGSFTGADEFIALTTKGGLIQNLVSKFTIYECFRGAIVPLVSYIWAGTGSLVRMPYILTIPLIMINIVIFSNYVSYLNKKKAFFTADSLFIWIFSAFYLTLMLHMLHVLALHGRGTTPGWYLNILFPWAVPAVGVGVTHLIGKYRSGLHIFSAVYIFLTIFQVTSIYFLLTLYTGCSSKGYDKLFEFQNRYFCLDSIGQTYERMDILGFPLLGLTCFLFGFSILFLLFSIELKNK